MTPDTSDISYELPAIASALPWKLNPCYTERFAQRLYDWLHAEFHDYPHVTHWWPHVRNSQLDRWAPLVMPDIGEDRLEAWNRQVMSWVIIDDINERRMATDPRTAQERNAPWDEIRAAIEIMRSHPSPPQGFERPPARVGVSAVVQATWDVAKFMSEAARACYLDASIDSLDSFVREESGFEREGIAARTDMDAYLAWRDHSYAMRIYFADVQDRALSACSAEELADPRLERLRRAVSLHAGLSNDLYSFRKEVVYRRDHLASQLNAITVLAFRYHRTWQQAVDETVAMVVDQERRYLACRDAWFAQGAPDPVRAYCRGLEHILAGNLRYLLTNPRYHGDDFTGLFRGARIRCARTDRELF